MSKLKKHYIGLIFIILGAVVCFSPYTLFPICSKLRPDGSPMSCYYTAKLVMALGLGIVIINVFGIFKRTKPIAYAVYLMNIVLAVVGIALPNRILKVGDMKTVGWQIAYCKKPMMVCNQGLKPALNIILPLIIVLSVFAIIRNFLRQNNDI